RQCGGRSAYRPARCQHVEHHRFDYWAAVIHRPGTWHYSQLLVCHIGDRCDVIPRFWSDLYMGVRWYYGNGQATQETGKSGEKGFFNVNDQGFNITEEEAYYGVEYRYKQ